MSDSDIEAVGWAFDPAAEAWRAQGILEHSEMRAWVACQVADPEEVGRLRLRMGRAADIPDRTDLLTAIAAQQSTSSAHEQARTALENIFQLVGATGVCSANDLHGVISSRTSTDQLRRRWEILRDDPTVVCADLLWSSEAHDLIAPDNINFGRPDITAKPGGANDLAVLTALLGRMDTNTARRWMASRLGVPRERIGTIIETGVVPDRLVTWDRSDQRDNPAYALPPALRATMDGWWPIATPGGTPANLIARSWPTGATVAMWGLAISGNSGSRTSRSGVWAAPVNGVHPWKLSVAAVRLRNTSRPALSWADAYRLAIKLAEQEHWPRVPADVTAA